MKKLLTPLLTASLLVSNIGVAPVTDAKAASITKNSQEKTSSITDLSKYETNDVIVVYKKDSNATAKKTLGICSLSKEEEKSASVNSLTDNSVVLSLDSKDALEDAVEALSADSRVDYVQPNYVYHLTDTDVSTSLDSLQKNPSFSSQWGFYNDGTHTYDEYDYRSGGSSGGGSDWYDWFPWFPWSQNYVEANSDVSALAQYDTITVTAQNRVDIKLPEAWDACDSAKREVVVAFVDTGVKYDHEDLKDSMWINEDEIADDGIDNDNNGFIDDVYGWNFYDESESSYWGGSGNDSSSENGNNDYYNKNSTTEDSHGTHGAGSVAAKNDSTGTVGVAANANVKIMGVKALGGSMGYGTTESVIKGIQYAEANGAHICNLSLGGEEDDVTLRTVIQNSKMLFTIAAGNGDSSANAVNNDSTPTYPASYNFDNTITVANLQCDGTLHYSSNYGATSVHLAAPGAHIYSTSTDSSGYEYMTGTSMAAPIVAGVAAMLYSCYDDLSIIDVKNIILGTTTKLDSLDGKCVSEGMLNAYAAVTYAETGEIPATTVPVNTPSATPVKETATPEAVSSTAPTKNPDYDSQPTDVPATKAPSKTKTPVTRVPANTEVPPTRVPDRTKAPANTEVPPTRVPDRTKAPANTEVPPTRVPNTTKAPANTDAPATETPATSIPTETPKDNSNEGKKQTASPQITKTPINTVAPVKTSTPVSDLDFVTIDDFSVSGENTRVVGETYTVSASASGGTGNYQYRFVVTKNGITKKFQAYSDKASMEWKPTSAGVYTIRVSVKDDNGDYDVLSQTVTISKFGISKISTNKTLRKGITVKLKATLKAGKTPYTYQFNITRSGKKVLAKKTKNNYVKWKITKKGNYKVKVNAKDAFGNSASKTITYKVKK